MTTNHLYASNLRGDRLEIEMIKSPSHGSLRLVQLNDDNSTLNMTRIQMEDLEGQRILYYHDDSETTSDSFKFLIRNIDSGVRQTGTGLSDPIDFNIEINLKNDNPPVQTIDRVFHVVRNGEKTITNRDLWFTDPDIDFNDENLIISRRGIDNGDIIDLRTSQSIYQFTQKDVLENYIVFRHKGDAYKGNIII